MSELSKSRVQREERLNRKQNHSIMMTLWVMEQAGTVRVPAVYSGKHMLNKSAIVLLQKRIIICGKWRKDFL